MKGHYINEDTLTSHTSILFDYVTKKGFVLAVNLGFLIRKNTEFVQPHVADELNLAVGVQIPIICDKLSILASVNMRTALASPFGSQNEFGTMIMGGVKYNIWRGLYATLMGGGGLGHMFGLPEGQVSLNFGWEPNAYHCGDDKDGDGIKDPDDDCVLIKGPKSTRGCPDKDGDGIADKDDACPNDKGPIRTKGCPDRDGDGIADKDDSCPDKAGPAKYKGCPDQDGDGLPDPEDECPKVKGPMALKGCPDKDGDGIADKDDKCPDKAGLKKFGGCPDTDGDGIQDSEDACPDKAGLEKFKGCPDTDGDGIQDSEDACPNKAGIAKFKGCPDQDGDGIQDSEDKCPDVPGKPEFKGCPPPTPKTIKVTRKKIIILKKVHFALDKAKIKRKSHRILKDVVKVLKDNPWVKKLQIEGHTDDLGKAKYNMWLSQRRADAVMKFLVKRGIAAERLVAKGYGYTEPLIKEKNKKARAANRRVVFKVIDPK